MQTMIRNPAPVITRTSHNQSDISLAILNFLAANGPCSLDVLHARFFEFQGRTIGRPDLYKLLKAHMGYGKLECHGPRAERLWSLSGELQEKVAAALPKAVVNGSPEAAKTLPPPPPYVGQIVPPRRVDVMFGPVYQPKPAACHRPGAMDFKGIARRGHAC